MSCNTYGFGVSQFSCDFVPNFGWDFVQFLAEFNTEHNHPDWDLDSK